MIVSSDTKELKGRFTAYEIKYLYEHVIKRWKSSPNDMYRHYLEDKRNGVFLRYRPLAPRDFDASLTFHGYSNDSQLLKLIFEAIPLHRWFARRIDIAFDFTILMKMLHALHPGKRADITFVEETMYMGGDRAPVQACIYPKQTQLWDVYRMPSAITTRVELRNRFSPMKRISDLTLDDFAPMKDYWLITDITQLPDKQRNIVEQLNAGEKKWIEVTRTNQGKIKKHATEQGLNLYEYMLSQITDLSSFIYQPVSNPNFKSA